MSPFKNRLKTPEEIELELKYQKLAQFKADLQSQEQISKLLKSEIRLFENVYEDILATRIEVLEDLEWQLRGLLGEESAKASTEPIRHDTSFSHFHHTTDLLDDEDNQTTAADPSLKSLYRSVAKSVHPDLALDEADRRRRQELMSMANEAYQTGNRQVLSDLLNEWEPTPVYNSSLDIAMELVRVIRQIASVEQNIHAMMRQIEEFKLTDIYLFKLRVEDALADGIDLLAEMAAKVDMDIARIRRRLFTLRNDGKLASAHADVPLETRIVRFPSDKSYGMLYIRKSDSVDYRDWQRMGDARGAKEVFLDKSLRLDVKGGNEKDIRFLAELQPNDLQSLFLYDVDDRVLPNLANLTGLQELYLSDTRISDGALSLLRPLNSLQRISIYHTAIGDQGLLNLALIGGLKWLTCSGTVITEDGLKLFRRVMPGCKAVSFKWRYEGQGKAGG